MIGSNHIENGYRFSNIWTQLGFIASKELSLTPYQQSAPFLEEPRPSQAEKNQHFEAAKSSKKKKKKKNSAKCNV